MAVIGDVIRANRIEEVLRLLGRRDISPRVLAGGTDLLLSYRSDPAESITLIDVTGVDDLAGIHPDDEGVSIGSSVKLADIIVSEPLVTRLPMLVRGASEVAGPQIRNLATIGGNVCNASPSADTVPPLLALDAGAEYLAAGEARSVSLAEFFLGPGETVLGSDGLLTALRIPWPPARSAGVYLKHSPRRAMDLAIVGAAVFLALGADGLQARIALGAVGPTPFRATAAEERLAGIERLDQEAIGDAAHLAREAASPVDDVRGSARYRRDMVSALVGRGLRSAASRLMGTGN